MDEVLEGPTFNWGEALGPHVRSIIRLWEYDIESELNRKPPTSTLKAFWKDLSALSTMNVWLEKLKVGKWSPS